MAYDPIHPGQGDQTPAGTSTGQTVNYKFILNEANTVTSWMNIFNTNMARIDTAIHDVALRTSIDGAVPPEAIEDIIKLNANVTELKELVASHSTAITQLTEQLTNLQTQTATNTADISTVRTNTINLDTRLSTAAVQIADNTSRIVKLETNATA